MESANLLTRDYNDVVDRQYLDNNNRQETQRNQRDIVEDIGRHAEAQQATPGQEGITFHKSEIMAANEAADPVQLTQFQNKILDMENKRLDSQLESKRQERENLLNQFKGIRASASESEVNAVYRSVMLNNDIENGDEKNAKNESDLEDLTKGYKALKSELKTANKELAKKEKELKKAQGTRKLDERLADIYEIGKSYMDNMDAMNIAFTDVRKDWNSTSTGVELARGNVNKINEKIEEQELRINACKADIKDWKTKRAAKLREFNGCMKVGRTKQLYKYFQEYDKKQSELNQYIDHLTNQKNNLQQNIRNTEVSDIYKKGSSGLEADDVAGKAIYINGYLYVENNNGDIPLNQGQVDKQSQLNAIRKQKIISALKSRDIFKQVNSDNIVGHYLKYDELGIGNGFYTGPIGKLMAHTKPKEQVINSSDVLGGIDGDSVVEDDLFNDTLFRVTGIKDTDSLYDAIRITDSINLHARVRHELSNAYYGNVNEVAVMADLGFRNTHAYHKITLSDVQNRMGYDDDWKSGLKRAVQKKDMNAVNGNANDTKWSRFLHRRRTGNVNNPDKEEMDRMRKEGVITLEQYNAMLQARNR